MYRRPYFAQQCSCINTSKTIFLFTTKVACTSNSNKTARSFFGVKCSKGTADLSPLIIMRHKTSKERGDLSPSYEHFSKFNSNTCQQLISLVTSNMQASYHLQRHENLELVRCDQSKAEAGHQQYLPQHHEFWLFSRSI